MADTLLQVFRKNPEAASVMNKSDEEWNYVLDTNLNGTFRCLRAQLNNIRDGGAIVNVTSVAGITGCPFDAPYGVSKHGVILNILT